MVEEGFLTVPPAVAGRAIAILGEPGRRWVEALPSMAAECASHWELRLRAPFPGLSYGYVVPAERADGTPVVLKLPFPDAEELQTQPAALRCFDGRGAVLLLDLDAGSGAMLLERAEPGTTLEEMEDDEAATAILAGVMRRLRGQQGDEQDFPTVAVWMTGFERLLRDRFEGGTGPLPAALVERAEGIAADFLVTEGERILLHGDLHHGNVLAAQREPWLAIDAKGVLGEAEFETAAMLRNPTPGLLRRPDPRRVQERRIALLSEALGYDRQRILGWGIAYAVLSAVWSTSSGADPSFALACAEILSSIHT